MSQTASFYHCSVKTVGRSAGRSVVAAAAYRLGEQLHDERYDQMHDYTRRSGVVESFTLAPEDAPDWALKPEALWNAADAAEKRINSTLAREVELALPAFLSPKDRRQITQEFAGELVERYGVAVTAAIHSPGRGDDRNYHAHILFTTREMMPDGLGKKTRVLDDRKTGPEEVKKLRELAADIINRSLAAANSDIRVDHRSFKDRGIAQEPTTHLGPAASHMERRNEASERGEINREAGRKNRQAPEQNAELAELDRAIAQEQKRMREPEPEPEAEKKDTRHELIELAADVLKEALFAEEGHEAEPGAWEQLGRDVQPFVKAVAQSGVVNHPSFRDGLKWWQRAALRAAQKVFGVARGLAQKTAKLWQPIERQPAPERDAAKGIWQQRNDRSNERGRNEGMDR